MSDEKKVTLLDLLKERASGDPVPTLREMADNLYASLTPLEKEVYHARMGARDAAAPLSEYTSITAAEAPLYCAGSERQRVRDVIRERVGDRTVLDYGCGPGIDAHRYAPERYCGVDVSPELVRVADQRNPAHGFFTDKLPVRADLWPMPFDCVMIKSVLEHTASVEDAVALLKNAMEIAREEVFVAWHTPPGLFEVRQRAKGHFGKLVHQNTYDMRAFEFARPRRVERVDNFELWTIDVRKGATMKPATPATPEREVTVLMPAGIVEDFVMVHEGGDYFTAYYTRGDSFQNQRLYARTEGRSPTALPPGREQALSIPLNVDDGHTRLYKGCLSRTRRLISAIWPGIPRCGIWCFTDLLPGRGMMSKQMVIPPGPPGSGYSYAAANPCARAVGDGWEIFFEGCDPLRTPGQPDWKIFRATWDGRGLAVVDPVPVIEGANPSLLEHGGRTYLYFSRLTPAGYAAGFETCVTVLE